MATIRKRGEKYQVVIRKKGYKQITRSFTLHADAQKWAKSTETRIESDQYKDFSEANRTTLRELLERFGREYLPRLKSHKVTLYRLNTINRHIGHLTLSSVTSTALAKYRDERLGLVKPATVVRELAAINRALKVASIEWGLLLPQGLPSVIAPKVKNERDRRLQEGEEELLLVALKDAPAVKSIVQFAVETAMRRGEIVAMQWHDVDLKQRMLKIADSKNGESRVIPLSTKAVSLLESLPRQIGGSVWSIRPHSFTQAFHRACRRVQVQNLHFHDLRHEAVSRLFEKGLTIMEVASTG